MRVAISFHSNVISISGLQPAILSSGCRSMSGDVGIVIFESGWVANVGVAFECASLSVSVQKLFLLPVCSPPFSVPVVGQCRPMSQCCIRIGQGRKCGGSL
jgi:hypothetical protein